MTSTRFATPRSNWILLLFILAFAGTLRWYAVSLEGYWTDELCSLSAADGWGLQLTRVPVNQLVPPLPVYTRLKDARPTWDIPGAMARDDAHPPVYPLLLRVWEDCFGDSEAATRSLNICFSLVAIGLLYVAARESIGAAGALWAALLMAVASPQITFALEARDYMPAVTFSLAAVVALFHLAKKPSIMSAVLFGLTLLVIMLTHYYCAAVAIALVLHGVIWMRGRSRRLVIFAAVVAAVVFVALWGPFFLRQIPTFRTGTQWLIDSGPGRLGRWWLRLGRVPGELVAADLGNWSVVFSALFLLLPAAYWFRPELRLWTLWLICAIGLIAGEDLLNHTTQMTLPRYLLLATPAAYVLLAGALRGRWRWAPPAAAALLALLSLRSAYVPAWKIDLRTPVQYVSLDPATDALVISGPDAGFDSIVYSAFQHYLPKMPAASAVLTGPADAQVLNRLRGCGHVWLLWMWPHRPIGQVVPGFTIIGNQRGYLPYFGDLMQGKVASVGTRPKAELKNSNTNPKE